MPKSLTSLLLCCLLTGSYSFAQSTDEKLVADRVENLRKLMITPEKTALEELAADDLSFGHSTGLIEDKSNFVNSFVSHKSVFTSVTLFNQTIKIIGDVAIVRHRMMGDTNNNNTPGKVDIIVLMIWQKTNGLWKLLARQAAKIPV
jgi:Domain of unknown function (DUF4440)